ncbi:MAG: hypothetical protein NTV62_01130 [Candidatus Gribaldobacteria bacterium]|nr:hypothetical protein [Candidatus Gribaldobacteria bacterium]
MPFENLKNLFSNKKEPEPTDPKIPSRLAEYPVKVVPPKTETALKLLVKSKQPFYFYIDPVNKEVIVSIEKQEINMPISGEVTLSGNTINALNFFDPEGAEKAIEENENQAGSMKTVRNQFQPVLELLLGRKLSS